MDRRQRARARLRAKREKARQRRARRVRSRRLEMSLLRRAHEMGVPLGVLRRFYKKGFGGLSAEDRATLAQAARATLRKRQEAQEHFQGI